MSVILKILFDVASFFDGNLLVLETNSAGKIDLEIVTFSQILFRKQNNATKR